MGQLFENSQTHTRQSAPNSLFLCWASIAGEDLLVDKERELLQRQAASRPQFGEQAVQPIQVQDVGLPASWPTCPLACWLPKAGAAGWSGSRAIGMLLRLGNKK